MGWLLFFVLFVVLVVVILFFPIVIETRAHYDMNRRKFAFGIYGYKLFKLFGGYIATYSGGFAIHHSATKATLLPYKELNSERKRFSFLRSFHLKSLVLTTETGADYLLYVAFAQTILRIFFFAVGGKKEGIENNVWLIDGDALRITLNFVVFFNVFILLKSALKILKEKIKISWQKKFKKSII